MNKLIDNTEQFISSIESRPPIYNFFIDEFRDKKLVEKLWEEIAAEFDTKVDYCKSKWVSLRSSLSRQIKNEKRNKTRNIKINDWYLLEKMSFMRNFMRRRRKRGQSEEDVQNPHSSTMSNSSLDEQHYNDASFNSTMVEVKNEPFLKDENESTISLEDFDFDSIRSEANFNESSKVCVELSKSETEKIRYQFQMNQASIDESNCKIQYLKSSPKRSRELEESALEFCKRLKIDQGDHQPFSAYEKQIEEQEDPPLPSVNTKFNEQEDSNMTFLKSILPDFNKLSGRRQRLLKQEILQNLNKFLDEQEDES